MKELILQIKKKKTLQNIDDIFIQEQLDTFFKKNPKLKNKELKEKEKKLITKEIRNTLNRIYGTFWKDGNLTLKSHQSTKEREQYYPTIYRKIFEKKNITSILDLACGLNPLSYKHIEGKKKFTATELTEEDIKKLNNYFKKNNINGKAIQHDLLRDNTFPKADMTFLFKILDLVDTKGHKRAEEILTNIKSKYIVVSFSTRDLLQKNMKNPRRGWFERLIERLNFTYEKFLIPGEEFYILNPHQADHDTRKQ